MMIVLIHAADSFLQRTQYHTNGNYRLDEQYNADTGAMMSAGDLVWSYASLVTASNLRTLVDPAATIAKFVSNSSVMQEFIVSDYDVSADSSKPYFRIVGSIPALGAWVPCAAGFASRTASARRCRDGKCDYSVLVSVPVNTAFQWKLVRTDAACSAVDWSTASNTVVAASNNGVFATSASWTRTA